MAVNPVDNSTTRGRPVVRSRADGTPATVAWQISAALLLALVVTASGLHVVLGGAFWWGAVVTVAVAVLGAAALVRAFTSRRALPPLAAAAVLIGLLTLFFAPGSALLGVIPTLDTLENFGRLLTDANTSIYRQTIPASADVSIVFVLCLGIGGLAVVADFLAITLRLPALAGVPLVVILAIPALTARNITDPFVFALAAAAYLLLLIAGRPRRQPGLAAGIGAVAIVGALVVPVVLPTITDSSLPPVAGLSTGVNPVLGLGDDLRRASERSVLDYSTDSGDSHYLRLVSLETFTGAEWAPTERRIDRGNSVAEFAPAPGLSADVRTRRERTEVDVGNLSSRWLPMPYPATSATGLRSNWFWEPDGFSVSSPDDTARGQDYVVNSLLLEPTPEQLLASGTTVTADFKQYLDLPGDLPVSISDTAADVAQSAETNYEKALALQEFFRSNAFDYSEEAPVEGDYDGTGMEIIAKFLDERSGYCIHFASAMSVMARSLDIPSRVIVGFLPGDAETVDGVSAFNVTTHDLHSWPELYFDGVGWVQFEPTPGRGELGDYADVRTEGVPAPPAPDAAAPGVAPTTVPSSSAQQAPDQGLDAGEESSAGSAGSGSVPWFALALLTLLLISLVPAVVRVVERWRLAARLRAGTAAAIDAWSETLRTAADLRADALTTATPRETVSLLGGGEPLTALLASVEREVYGGATSDRSALVREVVAARESLFASATPLARVLALLYPASVWRRIVHPFTKSDPERVENWRDLESVDLAARLVTSSDPRRDRTR